MRRIICILICLFIASHAARFRIYPRLFFTILKIA